MLSGAARCPDLRRRLIGLRGGTRACFPARTEYHALNNAGGLIPVNRWRAARRAPSRPFLPAVQSVKMPVMRAMILFIAALAIVAPGRSQSTSTPQALRADLLLLRQKSNVNSHLKQQIGEHILALSEKTHEPSSVSLHLFVNALADALAGNRLPDPDADALARDIYRVMQSAGTSTIGFHEVIQGFRARLLALGAKPAAAGALERIGREVRGPDDSPAQSPFLPRPRR